MRTLLRAYTAAFYHAPLHAFSCRKKSPFASVVWICRCLFLRFFRPTAFALRLCLFHPCASLSSGHFFCFCAPVSFARCPHCRPSSPAFVSSSLSSGALNRLSRLRVLRFFLPSFPLRPYPSGRPCRGYRLRCWYRPLFIRLSVRSPPCSPGAASALCFAFVPCTDKSAPIPCAAWEQAFKKLGRLHIHSI